MFDNINDIETRYNIDRILNDNSSLLEDLPEYELTSARASAEEITEHAHQLLWGDD